MALHNVRDAAGTSVRTSYGTPTSHVKMGTIMGNASMFHEQHSAKKFPVGTRVKTFDGRVYYYAKNSATAITATSLLAADVDLAQTDANLTYPQPIGSKTVVMTEGTAAAVSRSQFANGYLTFYGGPGRGRTMKVRDNSKVHASGTTFEVYLYDELPVALTIATDVYLHENPCYGVTITGDEQDFTLGINARTHVSASYYFWIQSWGPAAVQHGVASTGANDSHRLLVNCVNGVSVRPQASAGVTGAQIVGVNMYDSTNTNAAQAELTFLTCMP